MNHLVLLSTVPSKWQNDLWCRRCAINMGTGRDYWHLAFIFDIFVFYQISSLKSHTKAELCSFPINNFFLNMLVVHSPGCSPGKSSTTQDREWLFFFLILKTPFSFSRNIWAYSITYTCTYTVINQAWLAESFQRYIYHSISTSLWHSRFSFKKTQSGNGFV